MDESSRSGLKKLIQLFGVPSALETGCSIGGPTGMRILRNGRYTEYSIGGQSGQQILSREGEKIGIVSVHGRIYTLNGKPTNYRIGGRTGRKVLYIKVRRAS